MARRTREPLAATTRTPASVPADDTRELDGPLSLLGRASPRVQYVLACFLATERKAEGDLVDSGRLRRSLWALRPFTERGADPWIALDPSLDPLHSSDSSTKAAFFRIIQGPGPVIESGHLDAPSKERVRLGEAIALTATVTALPDTEMEAIAPDMEMEFGFGAPHTKHAEWTTWERMRFSGQEETQAKYKTDWEPSEAKTLWVLARCRLPKGPWIYLDTSGFDIADPAKASVTKPAVVVVSKLGQSDTD